MNGLAKQATSVLDQRKDSGVRNLRGVRLLIVEDEWLLADDLARYFSNMGAVILGPAATLEQAAIHTQTAEAAILDIDINGRRVFPIADQLLRRGVPFVFFSGVGDITIPEHLRCASNLWKSSTSKEVSNALFPPFSRDDDKPTSPDDVFALLPKLRLAARLLLADVNASDRLVERTLELALRDIDQRQAGLSTEDWLNRVMHNVVSSGGAGLLN
ncbi:MAG: response regulator [Mesorhizobium sp.]|uniref:response regulator n=1 Tax=unclassified Mesorhizobium TaxID=325217 RepID=UPI000FD2D70F|nr:MULTISPECIES: response regulator [unclassified Mesorhizobium]RUX01482.1 response regulator [Mesorhizobium sp. M8A.F.Ca.ET.023.01.1.1]RUX05956.1 response regulator [Mesorhizobium sp. M8A.F.Ca.ET.059.01.1.1]TGU93119.1 response regulator [Mesorhizobium sp. M00.F.Ca.ET.151.01.1.1]RWC70368.1 MAG: response regulator [Mesorhizobium sp.]RWC75656.1 MAG: response regulator [Mesorhizobium sp.]